MMSLPLNRRHVTGMSVRKVDDLVKALGADIGISKSGGSRIWADLDAEVAASPTGTSPNKRSPMCFSTRPTARPASAAPRAAGGRGVESQAVVPIRCVRAWKRRALWWSPGAHSLAEGPARLARYGADELELLARQAPERAATGVTALHALG